jgi:hypothetical protein
MVIKSILDFTGWSQDKINMVQAISIKLLHDNAITYKSFSVVGSEVAIGDPSGDVKFLTTKNLSDAYDSWNAAMDLSISAAQSLESAKQTELSTNALSTITLAQVDAAIDAISNLMEAKIFLKKLTRYIKSKE